jgi:hypothetical protein
MILSRNMKISLFYGPVIYHIAAISRFPIVYCGPVEAARPTTMSGRHTSGLTKPLDRTEAWLNQRWERFVAKLAVAGNGGSTIGFRCLMVASYKAGGLIENRKSVLSDVWPIDRSWTVEKC